MRQPTPRLRRRRSCQVRERSRGQSDDTHLSRFLSFHLELSLAILILSSTPANLQAQPVGTIPVGGVSRDELVADLDRLRGEVAATANAADAPALAGRITAHLHGGNAALAERIPDGWRVFDGDDRVDVSARWLIAALVAAPATPDAWPGTRDRSCFSALRECATRSRRLATQTGLAPRSRAGPRSNRSSRGASSSRAPRAGGASELQERIGRWFEDLWARFERRSRRRPAARRSSSRGRRRFAALIGLGFWLARTIADRPRGTALSLGAGFCRASACAGTGAPRARRSAPRSDARRRPVRLRRGARSPRRAGRLARRRRADAARVSADAAGDRQPILGDARPDPALRAALVRQPRGRRG